MANASPNEPELICGTEVVSVERAEMLTEHSPWEHSGGPDEGKEKVGGGEAHRRAYQVDPVSRWEMKVGACQWRWGLKLLGRGSVGRKMVQGWGGGGECRYTPGQLGLSAPHLQKAGPLPALLLLFAPQM